jgi:hypothetical protein
MRIDIANLSLHCHAEPGNLYILRLAEHLQKIIPHVLVSIIRDEDIHNGYIFTSNMSHTKNAFDMMSFVFVIYLCRMPFSFMCCSLVIGFKQ